MKINIEVGYNYGTEELSGARRGRLFFFGFLLLLPRRRHRRLRTRTLLLLFDHLLYHFFLGHFSGFRRLRTRLGFRGNRRFDQGGRGGFWLDADLCERDGISGRGGHLGLLDGEAREGRGGGKAGSGGGGVGGRRGRSDGGRAQLAGNDGVCQRCRVLQLAVRSRQRVSHCGRLQ